MKKLLIVLLTIPLQGIAEDLNPNSVSRSSLAPVSSRYELESSFSKEYQKIMQLNLSLEEKKRKLQELMAQYKGKLDFASSAAEEPPPEAPREQIKVPKPKPKVKKAVITRSTYRPQPQVFRTEPLQVFFVGDSEDMVTVSAGSFVMGTLLTGADNVSNELRPMVIELDGLVHKPNGQMLNLKGCRMIIQGKGDLSSERAMIQGKTLACSRGDNRDYEQEIHAFGASGLKNHLGLPGNYESRQGRVFTAAVLAKLAEGAGKAIALAQIREQISGGDNPVKSRNVSGDAVPFAIAQGGAEAASMIAEWYLNEAKKLMPYIEVVSGQRVWMITLQGFQIPRDIAEVI